MKKRIFILLIVQLTCCTFMVSQVGFSKEELEDYAVQAKQQVLIFFDGIRELGENSLESSLKEKAINNICKVFAINGTVEERGKSSKTGTIRKVREYLNIISGRGKNSPVLISYDFVDPLIWNEFKAITNPDSSITYRGEMIVRQYYCKLKPKDELTDKLSTNCSYSDVTDKKISVEIRFLKTKQGYYYAVQLTSISVLSVK